MYCIELGLSKGFNSSSSHMHHRKVEADGAYGGGPVVVSLRCMQHYIASQSLPSGIH